MTTAVGIHAHPTRKLGLRPHDPVRRAKAVRLIDFISLLPDHPTSDAAPDLAYPMDFNDQAGDCVVAGADHTLQVQDSLLGVARQNWDSATLLKLYQTQNPGFGDWNQGGGPDDGGMVIQQFLDYLVQTGVITAYGAVDPKNADEVAAATYLGLGLMAGATLTVAQQNQQVWDYVPNDAVWGGHCFVPAGYSGTGLTVVSWGALFGATEAFVQHQIDEMWFVLTPALAANPGFRDHFDLAGFAQAVSEVTGGSVVVPVDPPVPPGPPVPDPGPTPEAVLAACPIQTMRAWLSHRHWHEDRYERLARKAVETWLDAFNLG